MPRPIFTRPSTTKTAIVVWATLISAPVCYSQEIDTTNLDTKVCEIAPDFEYESVTDPATANWVKFQSLAKEWRVQSAAMSSVTAMVMLRPYQQIMGMGRDVIPFILSELKAEGDDPDQWFWALSTIAAANSLNPPEIREEDQGDYQKMAQAWLNWGADQRYVG